MDILLDACHSFAELEYGSPYRSLWESTVMIEVPGKS